MEIGEYVQCIGGFSPARDMCGEILKKEYVETESGNAGWVYLVWLDTHIIDRFGNELNGFLFAEHELVRVM